MASRVWSSKEVALSFEDTFAAYSRLTSILQRWQVWDEVFGLRLSRSLKLKLQSRQHRKMFRVNVETVINSALSNHFATRRMWSIEYLCRNKYMWKLIYCLSIDADDGIVQSSCYSSQDCFMSAVVQHLLRPTCQEYVIHCKTLPVRPKLRCNRSSSSPWSTQSNAADMSSRASSVNQRPTVRLTGRAAWPSIIIIIMFGRTTRSNGHSYNFLFSINFFPKSLGILDTEGKKK